MNNTSINSKQLIKSLLIEKGISQQRLAEMSGFKSQSNITGLINRKEGSMQINKFLAMLTALDCELIVRDNSTGSEYKITG